MMPFRDSSRAGFTLLEVMLACVLMSIAVLALMALIPTTTQLTETTEESNLAMQASHQISEAIRQYADKDFAYVWKAYNSDPSDDPNGAGTALGNTFSIPGLTATSESVGGMVGSITFFTDETLNTATSNKAGLPKDLNGDGDDADVDVVTVAPTYALLPYEIAVDWKDHAGLIRHTEIFSQVADY